jgi:hypothetical protein
MAKVSPIAIDMKIDTKAVDKAISKIRKVNKRPPPPIQQSNPIFDILLSIAGIFIIFPAIAYGTFTFFGAGFKAGLDAMVRMYGELVDDAKTWVR